MGEEFGFGSAEEPVEGVGEAREGLDDESVVGCRGEGGVGGFVGCWGFEG